MINFKAKDELGTTVAAVLGLLGLAGVLAYMLFVPPPSEKTSSQKLLQEQAEIVKSVDDAKAKLATANVVINKQTWATSIPEVESTTLSKLSSLARANGVKLTGLRPQRQTMAGELEAIPFVLSAEGSFPTVLAFVKAVENPENRLAVNLVQLTSAEGDSDKVTATVGLTAFRLEPKQVPKEEKDNG
jgi:type II secretory pathway component PulM